MTRTEAAIDLADPNSPQAQLDALVGTSRTVLDVAEVEDPDLLSAKTRGETYDAIVFNDVLGRLADPVATLRHAVDLLAPDGRLVLSVPNAAHASVRLAQLEGRWVPATTASRVFVLDSLCALLDEAGLAIQQLRATVVDPLSTEVEGTPGPLPSPVVEWLRDQPGALDHHYVVLARPLGAGEAPGTRPQVQRVVLPHQARLVDAHTDAVLASRDRDHRLLTQRDHIIGLEANLAAAEFRAADALVRAKNAEAKFRKLRKQHQALRADAATVAPQERPRRVRQLTDRLRPQQSEPGAAQDGFDGEDVVDE